MHPDPAADPLGRRDHVARHHLGEADPDRRVVRRPRHASPADRVLSDLASRPADRPLDHQLDRGSHDGQHRGLETERLVPAGRHRRLRPPFRGLDLGLARRAGAAPERGQRLREPDDRPRSGSDLAGRSGGCCSATPRTPMYPTGSNGGSQAIVDARVLGAAHGRARRHAGGACRLRRRSCAARSRSSSCATAAPGPSGCSTWSTNVAAARSTTSTM